MSQTVTKGSGPGSSLMVDGLTNRLTGGGFVYDANGNLTWTWPQGTINYDIENRVTALMGEVYGYAPDNKRVYKKVGANEEVYFYGVGGERLGVYRPTTSTYGTPYFEKMNTWKYLAGRRLQMQDRLGSVPSGGSRYYPYGEESAPVGYGDKFATYFRDTTGLDYADQRYYASTLGRFLTPDPYQASGGPGNPGSWNRYTYVLGDPINLSDPQGLEECSFVNGVCQVYGGGLPNSLAQLQQDGQRFYNPIAVQNAPTYAEYMAQRTAAETMATTTMPQGLATLARVGQLAEPWKNGLVAASAVVNGVGLVAVSLPVAAGFIAQEGTTLVIGTVASTTGTISRFKTFALDEGEYKLSWVNRGLDAWNKAVNRDKLLDAMKNGMKIRDSFVDEAGRLRNAAEGSFLEWERNVIKAAGWTYDEATQMWGRP